MKNKALIYHTDLPKNPTLDESDVLDEVRFVSEGLKNLGYEVVQRPFKFNSENYSESAEFIGGEVRKINPDFAFNLVESINGEDRLSYLAAQVFEELNVPYTGCPLPALLKLQTKTAAKEIMIKNGIPTPIYFSLNNVKGLDLSGRKFLVKSDANHASKGLEAKLLQDKGLTKKMLENGEAYFAEEYIDGREFNVSIIGSEDDGVVLPIAEIVFSDWPEGRPKMVGYEEKWDRNSEFYKKTNRTFDFPESDGNLLSEIEKISKKCWDVFRLKGYARIDFRVDDLENPYVLELNPNPGIDYDSGFVAATQKAGIKWEDVLRRIIFNCNLP